jgi:hypothetical protein
VGGGGGASPLMIKAGVMRFSIPQTEVKFLERNANISPIKPFKVHILLFVVFSFENIFEETYVLYIINNYLVTIISCYIITGSIKVGIVQVAVK